MDSTLSGLSKKYRIMYWNKNFWCKKYLVPGSDTFGRLREGRGVTRAQAPGIARQRTGWWRARASRHSHNSRDLWVASGPGSATLTDVILGPPSYQDRGRSLVRIFLEEESPRQVWWLQWRLVTAVINIKSFPSSKNLSRNWSKFPHTLPNLLKATATKLSVAWL